MTHPSPAGHSHEHHHAAHHASHCGHHHNAWIAAAHATLHCSIGCILGETLGLIAGTSFGFSQVTSMVVSTALAYVCGFSLAVFPLMRRTGMTLPGALSAIWIGEAVSIGVMELVMNTTDYHMGGMRTGSIVSARFWIALACATALAFLVAWPVNGWLIARKLRAHH